MIKERITHNNNNLYNNQLPNPTPYPGNQDQRNQPRHTHALNAFYRDVNVNLYLTFSI